MSHYQVIGVLAVILGLIIIFTKRFSNWIQLGRAGPIGKKRLSESQIFASDKSRKTLRVIIGVIIIILGIIILIKG